MSTIRALIMPNLDKVIEIIKEAERLAYRNPNCEYRAYIDSEGETDTEEWIAGSNGWYEFKGNYERHYIYTACHEYYSILWDWWFDEEENVKAAFKARFGIELNTNPEDEDGWPIDESILDNAYRQGRESGILSSEINDWLYDETEEAIEEALRLMDVIEIINEHIKNMEEAEEYYRRYE